MMSPETAWASAIFWFYLYLAAGLLSTAGILIFVLSRYARLQMSHARDAYRGWLVMIPVVFLCLFLGREATILFFAVLTSWAFYEFARATGLANERWLTTAVHVGIAACALVSLLPDATTDGQGWYGMFMALPVFAIATIVIIPILQDRAGGQLQMVALAILGFIYIGWMFLHVGFLANSRNAYGYLLFIVFAVEVNDVAAYTFGKIFGQRPLRPHISPNKTWGGALGALAVSLVLPWSLRFSFPHFSPWQLLLTGLIVGIGGQLGDLSISMIKRDAGVKDMGTAIRGHGGILDRIDSVIYVAPLFFHMTRYYHGL